MKEVLVHQGLKTQIIESPIPSPGEGEIVIKVDVSGTNPKDWKTWWAPKLPVNMGDDMAGMVHEVGQNVTGFKAGDRVFALHRLHAPHGSYAQYALAPANLTAHLPLTVSCEEAATIPLAALTASLALYRTLNLPQPWSPASSKTPLLIYGGSSAVGAFAIKLATQSNIHPIIAVAGAGKSYVSSLLDTTKGDAVVDYRLGRADLEACIRSSLSNAGGLASVTAALDAICENESSAVCMSLLQSQGKLAHVLPLLNLLPEEQRTAELVNVNDVQCDSDDKPGARDFGYIMMQSFSKGLEVGWLRGHPYRVVAGGLRAVPTILEDLKAGKPSASKYVFRICETEGMKPGITITE